MTIESLKELIETNADLDSMYIFLNSENTFLSNQYIVEISKKKNLKIVYVEDLKALIPDKNDIFGVEEIIDSTCLYVYHQETFDFKDSGLKELKNLIIVCDKIDDETKEIFDPYIIKMPKLEEWMIKDYVYTIADGVDTVKLDWLIKVANNDIYRIENEIAKISIFPKVERNYIFDLLMEEDAFADLNNYHIFDLSTALLQKDLTKIAELIEDVKSWDCEPLGLQVLTSQNFRKVLQIQLSPKPDPDKLGLTSKQIWAIQKYNCGFYSRDQLVKIFDKVTYADYMMKNGDLSNDKLVDYLILNILSA